MGVMGYTRRRPASRDAPRDPNPWRMSAKKSVLYVREAGYAGAPGTCESSRLPCPRVGEPARCHCHCNGTLLCRHARDGTLQLLQVVPEIARARLQVGTPKDLLHCHGVSVPERLHRPTVSEDGLRAPTLSPR
jgi:hypothetical protein